MNTGGQSPHHPTADHSFSALHLGEIAFVQAVLPTYRRSELVLQLLISLSQRWGPTPTWKTDCSEEDVGGTAPRNRDQRRTCSFTPASCCCELDCSLLFHVHLGMCYRHGFVHGAVASPFLSPWLYSARLLRLFNIHSTLAARVACTRCMSRVLTMSGDNSKPVQVQKDIIYHIDFDNGTRCRWCEWRRDEVSPRLAHRWGYNDDAPSHHGDSCCLSAEG